MRGRLPAGRCWFDQPRAATITPLDRQLRAPRHAPRHLACPRALQPALLRPTLHARTARGLQTMHLDLALQARLFMATFEGSVHYSQARGRALGCGPGCRCKQSGLGRPRALPLPGAQPSLHCCQPSLTVEGPPVALALQAGTWLAPQLAELMPWLKLGERSCIVALDRHCSHAPFFVGPAPEPPGQVVKACKALRPSWHGLPTSQGLGIQQTRPARLTPLPSAVPPLLRQCSACGSPSPRPSQCCSTILTTADGEAHFWLQCLGTRVQPCCLPRLRLTWTIFSAGARPMAKDVLAHYNPIQLRTAPYCPCCGPHHGILLSCSGRHTHRRSP